MKQRKGNTILEMLVACFVLTVGLIAVIGLSFRNVIQGRESLKQLQAANFAREGVEIVRNIRDSNKYKPNYAIGDNIWNGLKQAGGTEQIIDNSGFSTTNTFGLAPSTASPSNTSVVERSDHFFIQGTSTTGTPTQFQRTLRLYAICTNGQYERTVTASSGVPARNGSPSTCNLVPGAGTLIGIEVVSTVTWQEESNTRSLVAEEQLYNW